MTTLERLRQLVDYNPETGVFTWKEKTGKKVRVGHEVGSVHSQGYIEAMIDRKRWFLHRLAWFYVHGEVPPQQIDHINGNRADNRIGNLRVASQQQNSGNMRIRSSNQSGLKGVYWRKDLNRWSASIHVNYKTKNLGLFETKEDAHAAYMRAAAKTFGEFARSA